MKNKKFFYLSLIATIVVFCGIMLYVRLENNHDLDKSVYHQWNKLYIRNTTSNSRYVNTARQSKHSVALSEAQGYGMLITALAAKQNLAKKADYDKLYQYYLDHRTNINGKSTQLMAWRQVYKNKYKNYPNTATDGDLLIAHSLIIAYQNWKNDKYRNQAKSILKDILKYEYNSKEKILTVGNWADQNSRYYNLMRSSDVMPVEFEQFYKLSGDKRWLIVKDKMLSHLNSLSKQHKSGLVPDFAWIRGNKCYTSQS